ncbi:hypothetical protein [Alteromonas sp. BMJM2]|uniref:hypothetical protein n=1 Tax=Alteromonas sp. BMJM2 TaxID=2954241 RepID=UPI0022B4366E|nr:hypothetical protein [Alteromonas sp. BMJM2]
MKVEHNKVHSSSERTYLFQTVLGSGTVKLFAKIQGMDVYTLLKDFEKDEMVAVELPNGQWKAEITGDAKVAVST